MYKSNVSSDDDSAPGMNEPLSPLTPEDDDSIFIEEDEPTEGVLKDAIRALVDATPLNELSLGTIKELLAAQFSEEFVLSRGDYIVELVTDVATAHSDATQSVSLTKKPKGASSSYIFFTTTRGKKLREEQPGLGIGDYAKLLGAEWKNLSDQEKIEFQDMAAEDKVRYEMEMEDWLAANPDAEVKSKRGKPTKKKAKDKAPAPVVEYDSDGNELVPEKSAFDLAVERQKRKSRRHQDLDDDTVAVMVHDLLHAMDAAYTQDLECIKNKQPAVNKYQLVKRVVREAKNSQLQSQLMDNEFLDKLRDWLRILPDGSLPASAIRVPLYELLAKLPIDESYLLETNFSDPEQFGLGKAVIALWDSPEEDARNKSKLRSLIEKWLRPMMKVVTDYKHLAEISAAPVRTTPKKRSARAGPIYQSRHAQIPRKAEMDYSIRPASTVDESRRRKRKSEPNPRDVRLMNLIQSNKKSKN